MMRRKRFIAGWPSSRWAGSSPIMPTRTPTASGFGCPRISLNLHLATSRTGIRVTRIEKLCVDKGLRMTEQRSVIARVLSTAEDHPDAEDLYRRAAAID